MHGIMNAALQVFLRDTYGMAAWRDIALGADLPFTEFEALRFYDDDYTAAVLTAAEARLGKRRRILLEDLGTFLVSHPSGGRLRRLLRFGGSDFRSFLQSLDELPDWARLAVPDLDPPQIEVTCLGHGRARVICTDPRPGFGPVLAGVLRAMADDYGALAQIDFAGRAEGRERIEVRVHEFSHTRARDFELAPAS